MMSKISQTPLPSWFVLGPEKGPVRGALFHRLPHQSKFVNHPYILNSVDHDKIVIQGATDLLQQPELCG